MLCFIEVENKQTNRQNWGKVELSLKRRGALLEKLLKLALPPVTAYIFQSKKSFEGEVSHLTKVAFMYHDRIVEKQERVLRSKELLWYWFDYLNEGFLFKSLIDFGFNNDFNYLKFEGCLLHSFIYYFDVILRLLIHCIPSRVQTDCSENHVKSAFWNSYASTSETWHQKTVKCKWFDIFEFIVCQRVYSNRKSDQKAINSHHLKKWK